MLDKEILNLKEQIKNEKSPLKKVELLLELARRYELCSPEEAKRHATQALAIAKENQATIVTGMILNYLGRIYYHEGRIEDAIEYSEKALKTTEITKDKSIQANAHGNIGLCLEQKGEIDQAIGHYEKSIDLLLEIGDENRISRTYNNLGNAFWDKGDLEKALEYHQKSLALKEKLQDSRGISVAQNNLGLIHEDLGDLEKAIECFYRSLVEKEKCNDQIGIPRCYNNIGEIYLKRGRIDKAIQLFEQAVKAAEDANVLAMKAEACGNLGNAYFLSGDYIRGMNYYIEDMNLSLEINDKFELSEVYWRTGELLLVTKEEHEAFNFIQKAVALSSEIGAKKNEASAQRILGKYYAILNEPVKARTAFEQGIQILEGMSKCYELGKIYFDYGSYLTDTGVRDTALRYLREASMIFRKLEIVNESETVERLLFQLELERDRRVVLIRSLSSLTSHLLPVSELAPKCLKLLQAAVFFDAGAFFLFETKPFVLGNITQEQALEVCKRGELELTPLSVNVPLRLTGHELGVLYLRWKSEPPFNLNPALFESIGNILSLALEHTRARISIKPEVPKLVTTKPTYHFDCIVGDCPKMLEIYDTISRVAPTKACVLLRGESGTGKEIIAKTIHSQSQRVQAPFVTINCAAIPEALLESELFGVERGTATGVGARIGKFEQAQGGTVFLDEIGDMNLTLQSKILRVLQEKKFERVGGRKTIEADVRIIAATNKNLEQEISQGNFREDLFYRLNVITMNLPLLRERKEDIPQLVTHFTQKYNEEMGHSIKGITPEAMDLLLAYSWPGNIRELENTLERAVILAKHEYITPADLPPTLTKPPIKETKPIYNKTQLKEAKAKVPKEARASLEKDFILQLLIRYNWNISRAVKTSGISRSQFYRLLAKYNIKKTIESDGLS
ncbi:MAG: sigma 54-interacting transcriptional regulator [candidate division WOR-3 bacterium]|nr:sigma 54-interacting transcriptional regulator [candidate division WOR-3 bacterium]